MSKQEILVKIQDALASEFEIARDKVVLDASLYEDLDLDSLDAVDLMAFIAELTGKRVSPEDFMDARTVLDVVNVIDKLLREAS